MMSSNQLPSGGSKVRTFFGRLSLRARLLLGLILVATLGIVVADVVIYRQISSYLNTQVNNELQSGASTVVDTLRRPTGSLSTRLPLDTAAVVETYNGTSILANPTNFNLVISNSDLKKIGKSLQAATSSNSNSLVTASLFTTTGKSVGASASYRVLPVGVYVTTTTGVGQAIAFIAIPLASLNGTLHELIVVGIAVSAAVIALLGLIGYAVVRIGLRPLFAIEETAGAIAGGDLSRRVERQDETTEIGRLGASLNAMLGQIEHAFTEQEASEDRLRQFLADASHELRTPVTSIRGYAELFRRGAADRPADLAQAMRRIEDESVRMGGLVDDLLLLARLDQGRALETQKVDLALIATDAAADASVLSPDRPISVDVQSAEVQGDEQRLRQVVMNLVNNALRHTGPEVPVKVSVKAEGDKVILAVIDGGQGIPKEHASHIFERFYRGDPSRTRESGGSGLGLAIVASIAEAHHGTAKVDSIVGVGTTFIVELPRAKEGDLVLTVGAHKGNGQLPINGLASRDEARKNSTLGRDDVIEAIDETSTSS